MDVSAETLQAFLDNAWDAAAQAANTFRPQLRLFESQATALFARGSIGSVSKNSVSQSYRGPGLGSYTPVQIANSWRTLINLYDEELQRANYLYSLSQTIPPSPSGTWFIGKFPEFPGNPNANPPVLPDPDNAVYFFMGKRLFPVEFYETDLTLLRTPEILGPAGYGYTTTW